MSYSRQEILDKCSEALKNINTFYDQDFVNYRDKTDEGEYFTEIVAEFVIDHIDEFKGIEPIPREEYTTGTHDGKYSATSNRIEEITAMKMFNQCKKAPLDFIGKIIDYQTPLKNKLKGDKAGKIDLLSDDEDGKQLIILELKKPDSKETMLRCVLEGYTYLRRVNKEKLLESFKRPGYGLSTSPLVPKGGRQQQEMQEDRPKLKKLMKMLDIKPYYYSEKDGKFIIEDK